MPGSSPRTALRVPDPVADLTARAAAQRPDLAAAFADDGWVVVRLHELLITRDGIAFEAGDLALARPAVARRPEDFIVYSERSGTLAGLRHGEHFRFPDEADHDPR